MTLAEDRIHDETRPAFRAYVTSGYGVTVLEVAGDRVGGYALAHECTAVDVADAGDGTVAVATPEAVLVGDHDDFEPSGFGEAVAVGGDPLLAASPDGEIARLTEEGWDEVGTVATDVRAIDGDLLATADGVYRVTEGGIEYVGLERARDVSTVGIPHAATATGLYKLGAGWMTEREGGFTLVTGDPNSARGGVLKRGHAATEEQLFVYDGSEWGPWHIPVDAPVAGIDYGEAVYAVSEDGTFITAMDGEWRTRALGISGVTGLVVRPMENA